MKYLVSINHHIIINLLLNLLNFKNNNKMLNPRYLKSFNNGLLPYKNLCTILHLKINFINYNYYLYHSLKILKQFQIDMNPTYKDLFID